MVREACEKIGRDPATLETSVLVIAIIDENASLDVIPEEMRDRVAVGTPEQIAEQIKTKVLDAGIDGVVLSPLTNLHGYVPGGITAVAEALKPYIAE